MIEGRRRIFLWQLCLTMLSILFIGAAIITVSAGGEHKTDDASTILIVGYEDAGTTQRLPTQYVLNSFERWVWEDQKLAKIPSISSSSDKNQGFVNPTSITNLWWPVDLPIIQIRPSIDIVLSNGKPTYVAAGMDVRVPIVDDTGIIKTWRNHGLNSQPLAKQWTTFESVGKPNFRIEVFIEDVDDEIESSSEKSSKYAADAPEQKEIQFQRIASTSEATKHAIESLGVLLASLEDTSPLSKRFHIVSIPLDDTKWVDLPVMGTVVDRPYMAITIGTSLPDAGALLNTKRDLAAMMGTTFLAVEVMPTAPGKESPNLPKAYEPLYKK